MHKMLLTCLLVLPGLLLACVAVYAPRQQVMMVAVPDAPEPPPELEEWSRTPSAGP